jgi:integrase
MAVTITPTSINAAVKRAAATGSRVVLKDSKVAGLQLRITKHGVLAWSWCGRVGLRIRTFTLGYHPHIGIAAARDLARAMAYEARFRGADPVRDARKQRARAREPAGQTLEALLALYGEQVGSRIKSWPKQMEPQIRRVFRPHLCTPLAALTVGVLQMTADAYASKKSASFGVRCLLTVLRWASAPGRGYVDRSMLDLRATAPKPSRDRVLSREELAALQPALQSSDSPYAAGLRLILLTAARRGEVSAARWRDIDFTAGTWTLPLTKNGQKHVVPLSRQAIALLRSLQPAEVDPAAHVFAIKGKALGDWEAATERLQKASSTGGWQRHDLRRTAATMMGELGVVPEIIEAALNHVTIRSHLATIYNKSRYRPEVAVALQRLADSLDGIISGGAQLIRHPALAYAG